jgi:hypothetical protein
MADRNRVTRRECSVEGLVEEIGGGLPSLSYAA